eukprot:SAG11_NODE_2569_length_3213_cov_1.421002_1_plen_35_part_00
MSDSVYPGTAVQLYSCTAVLNLVPVPLDLVEGTF